MVKTGTTILREGRQFETDAKQTDTDDLNNTIYVETEAELESALGSDKRITFKADITTADSLLSGNVDIGGQEHVIDLNGYTLKAGDDIQSRILSIQNAGRFTIKNGLIDGNRSNQTEFPGTPRQAIHVEDAPVFRCQNVELIDNFGFGFSVINCGDVFFQDVEIDSNPSGLGSDAAGLDGIHVFDPTRVNISNPSIISGDDAIAITARDSDVRDVSIQGGVLSSPEHANGIRINIDSTAGSDIDLQSVNIDTIIENCAERGIVIINESGNGNAIETLRIDGIIRNVVDNGITLSNVAINDAVLSGVIKNFGNGSQTARRGIVLRNSSADWLISAVIDGDGNSNAEFGVFANGADDGVFTGTVKGVSSHGINGTDANSWVVTGASIHDNTNRSVITSGTSDNWRVVGNDFHDNGNDTPSFTGSNSLSAINGEDSLTAADGSTVDSTYGTEERDVIQNLVTRVGEIEDIIT